MTAVALAIATACAALYRHDSRPSWPVGVAFLLLLAAAEYSQIQIRHRNDVMALNLVEAVLAPVVFVFPPVLAIAVVAAAQALAGTARRNHPLKLLFNVAQWATAAGAAGMLLHALRRGTDVSVRNLAALVVAMTAVALLNLAAFTTVMRLADPRREPRMLRSLIPALMLGWTVNTAFGMLFVASSSKHPWTVTLFVVPMLTLHWAYRAHTAVVADRARLRAMHRATRALAGPIDPRDALPEFLAEARACFGAEAVELVIAQPDGTVVAHRSRGDADRYTRSVRRPGDDRLVDALLHASEPIRLTRNHGDAALVALLEDAGRRECLATPVRRDGPAAAALCVFDRSGPDAGGEAEIVVLQALGDEAGVALQKAALLDRMLDERRTLAQIVNHTSDGIFSVAPDGTVLSWNGALERITGYARADMVGSRLLSLLDPRDGTGAPIVFERWIAGAAAEPPSDVEVAARSGERRWLSCSITRTPASERDNGSFIVVARDATKARETERLRDDFVAAVSHELRTPLTPIRGWATTLLQLGDRADGTQRDDGLRSILRQAERLERLVTNLLEVSRLEGGESDQRTATIDAAAVVRKVVDEFAVASPERSVVLIVDSGPHDVVAKDLWIEQIIANLLSNALKYAPPTEPIDVRVDARPRFVEVSVTDRGQGIPAHEAERIFERFRRLDDDLTRSKGGAGLGLYIARRMAQATGGSLTVRGGPGRGSTFVLRLPAHERPAGML